MSEELEIQKINVNKIKEFWKKYHLTIIVLLLIPLFLASYYRAYSYDLPATNEWAESTVIQRIQDQIGSNIMKEYPDIDETTYNNLVSQQTNLYIEQNKDLFNQQVEMLHQQIKANFQDEKGHTYILGIDEYYYYRQAVNVVENGDVGDELVDGKPFDNHMVAPNGKFVESNLHPFITAYIYKIVSIFFDTTVKDVIFFVPLLFAALTTIPTFFIVRRVVGNVGGLVAASLLAISQSFFVRTAAGAPDTDVYTVFFSVLIAWLFLESFGTKYEQKKKKIILAILAGLSTGLFAFAWGGWWYIFDFILGTIFIYLLYLLIKYKKKIFEEVRTKNAIVTAVSYLASTLFFVSIIINIQSFIDAVSGPISVFFLKEAAKESLWPNVYNTVAELGETNFSAVMDTLGGKLLFLISILGIVLFLLKKNKKQLEVKYSIFLILWFVGTLYSTTKGVRFTMYMVPVHAIGVGIFAGVVYNWATEKLSKSLEINKKIISILLIIVIILLFIKPVKNVENIAKSEIPMIDDGWVNALTNIKENSSENAIITSWWDYGHWFKAIADRAVTFDGASQNKPQAHWVGRALTTNNEDEAMGILRMLNCGANDAYDILLEKVEDPLLAKKILDEALPLNNKEEARKILADHIDNPDEVLDKMFCEQRENYFITSEDMVSKGGVWAHFGSWDFERAFVYNTINTNSKENAAKILSETLDYTEEEIDSVYRETKSLTEKEADSWISPYPSYSNEGSCNNINGTMYCSNGVIVYQNEKRASINTNNGLINLKYYRDENGVYETNNGTEEIAVAFITEDSKAILMDPKLIDSMFTKLFYYGGKNLDHFELFDYQQGINGFEVYVWKIKW